jgi:glutathione S-transferase
LRTLGALERGLADSPFLAGERMSIADIAVYAYSHLAGDCGYILTDYPAFHSWLARVKAAIGPGYPVHPYSMDPHSAA